MSPEKCLAPDILKPSRLGSHSYASGSSSSGGFNFTPIGPPPASRHIPQLARPIPSNQGTNSTIATFKYPINFF